MGAFLHKTHYWLAFPGGGTSLQQFRGALGPKRKSCGRAIYSAALEKQDEKKKKERKKNLHENITVDIHMSAFGVLRGEWKEWRSARIGSARCSSSAAAAAVPQRPLFQKPGMFISQDFATGSIQKKKKKVTIHFEQLFLGNFRGERMCAFPLQPSNAPKEQKWHD